MPKSNNLVIAISIMCLAIFGVFSLSNPTIENFLGNLPSMVIKNTREYACSKKDAAEGRFHSVPLDYQIPGTFQPQMAPRFSNTNYGPNLQYKMPDSKYQAVPIDPLNLSMNRRENYMDLNNQNIDSNRKYSQFDKSPCTGNNCYEKQPAVHHPNYSSGNYAQSVNSLRTTPVENYTNCPNTSNGSVWYGGTTPLPPNYSSGNYGDSVTSLRSVPVENFEQKYGCGSSEPSQFYGAPLLPPDYASGNYQDIRNNVYNGGTGMTGSQSILPVADTSSSGLDPSEQPIIYDRYIVSNRTSRLRSQADKIRGDIPITPDQTSWFQVSAKPNIDLEAGAMNIMGGINNETSNKLAELMYASSGNSMTSFGGVNMSTQLSSKFGAAGSDLIVSAM
jgi:hypothetical protein